MLRQQHKEYAKAVKKKVKEDKKMKNQTNSNELNAAPVEDSFKPATEATLTEVTSNIPNATNTYRCVSILQMCQDQGNR